MGTLWDDAYYLNVKIDSWIGREKKEREGRIVMLLDKGYRKIETLCDSDLWWRNEQGVWD